ncbi:unnamed protein product [Cyprideis torosa]|uniref:Uncharacterized protein n=1 Tax=Cyprideis torosa TaxID=163714 RepID=A0A7R8W8H9_9CRUS|nr:unnamed protein product [Cyprideis torosa]CAG0888635.1 unnamed protein product [Cyprideis torosa]
MALQMRLLPSVRLLSRPLASVSSSSTTSYSSVVLPDGFTAAPSTHDPKTDAPTHTGQTWDASDYRNVRFLEKGATKEVNPNWAIKLIHQVPVKKVKDRKVWCDGGHPELGHPKVYINLDQPGPHTCGYCGLRYEQEKH